VALWPLTSSFPANQVLPPKPLRSSKRQQLQQSQPLIPPVGPGQYLKVDTKAVYAAFGGLSGPPSLWLDQANSQMYVPADRNGERTVLLRTDDGFPSVPAGTAISWTAIETSVVNSAP
jgi:hypothetical protein